MGFFYCAWSFWIPNKGINHDTAKPSSACLAWDHRGGCGAMCFKPHWPTHGGRAKPLEGRVVAAHVGFCVFLCFVICVLWCVCLCKYYSIKNSLTPISIPAGTKNSCLEGFLLAKHKDTNIPTMMEPFPPPAAWFWWMSIHHPREPTRKGLDEAVVKGFLNQ